MNKKLKAAIIEGFGSQADFALVMKLDESLVSRVVNGRRILGPEDSEKWCRVLGVDSTVFEEKV